ncbi:14928_t:CDS:2 [Gigaspora margarita]|uniref:14928_t:CDS:1 n=1 Tax=Gigaspora margarita TaxID=4874 RepID=A0ABN7VDJ7_GIGMA|nr:14928_t:CDS:2 [Gigaspora margarita]
MSFTNLKKKWKAIKSTRVTTIFASLAVIQFLVLESLQLKILVQHINLAEYVVPNLQLSRANSTCYLNDMLTPLSLPYSENAIFLIFHAFQLSFIIDSFQAQDSNALITGLQQTCTKLDPTYLYSSFTGIEVPHLAMAFVFTAFVAALTYFFHKMFGLIEYATNLSEDALNFNHLSLQEYESSLFLQKAKVIDSENHRDMRTWRSEE